MVGGYTYVEGRWKHMRIQERVERIFNHSQMLSFHGLDFPREDSLDQRIYVTTTKHVTRTLLHFLLIPVTLLIVGSFLHMLL